MLSFALLLFSESSLSLYLFPLPKETRHCRPPPLQTIHAIVGILLKKNRLTITLFSPLHFLFPINSLISPVKKQTDNAL
ncbi:hypothetical protein V8C37DRAFT_392763 [Trichoderma ceciliae]